MTSSVAPPQLDTEIGSLKKRVTDLERQLRDRDNLLRPDTVFTLAGALFVSESTPYPAPVRRNYREVVIELGTATTSGTLTVECRREGVAVATIDVAVGLAELIIPVDIEIPKDGVITTAITAAGTGGRDITVAWRT